MGADGHASSSNEQQQEGEEEDQEEGVHRMHTAVERAYFNRLYLTRKRSFVLLVAFDLTYFLLLMSARFMVTTSTSDDVPYSFGYSTGQ